MPPKKALATVKDVVAKDASAFDIAAWLRDMAARGYKPRNVPVKLHMRADLLPRINELIQKIQAEQELDVDREVSLNDVDPAAADIAEYEQLSAEFAAGGYLEFVFRPMTKTVHNGTFRKWEAAHPEDNRAEEDWDELALMRMAATCVDFPGKGVVGDSLTVEALRAFEETYGTPAFNTLVFGWNEAYASGGEVTAPFSPKPSPTPDTAG